MTSYRSLFRTPEFTPLFLASSAQVAAQTMSGLALGTLVYRATDSPLLSALSMFGPSLAQVLGATTLLSAADRLPPRATLTGTALAFAVGTAALAAPPPLWGIFALILVLGLVASLGGGVRWGLLNEILREDGCTKDAHIKDGYILGRSVFNMANGVTQVVGFATGGVLIAFLSARGTLLTAAALYATAAAVSRLALTARPPRATGRPSLRETRRTNAALLAARPRRHLFLALWIPNGLIVGCESLYVSYAPDHAGLLFACAALGMLVGDVTVARFVPPRLRPRLGVPLLLLLAAPYVFFVLRPGPFLAAGLATLASAGFAASLLQQERLMAVTPPELSGHALGLHSSGMLTMQGVGAALAGATAQLTSPGTAMTVIALASIAVTVSLAPGLRPAPRAASAPRTA
ncbi:MFS transporter [Streptomyces phaeochromogenes]|uniref:MFS transporter n=1 Tax=Streptomyces phaeochromogenes TaxID=1923 RepID=A0ABZ1HV95_STRPH|nr:MFS transporter [Streptomyces phaeochromogenes]WSD21633.1 MFS transporter [Streptomyces phaeochromogenes]